VVQRPRGHSHSADPRLLRSARVRRIPAWSAVQATRCTAEHRPRARDQGTADSEDRWRRRGHCCPGPRLGGRGRSPRGKGSDRGTKGHARHMGGQPDGIAAPAAERRLRRAGGELDRYPRPRRSPARSGARHPTRGLRCLRSACRVRPRCGQRPDQRLGGRGRSDHAGRR